MPFRYGTNQQREMKTITLTGMDEADLNKKQWDWQTSGQSKKILKQWPDERLLLQMKNKQPGSKIVHADQFSRRVDYED
jgi:hypothetical protein